uniref:DUF302 domain-containing protein n=1 Tax=Candidatus Kentrum sp. FM TaxID=2126340 RepID=A0A450T1I0_9GAMM|nr:MAG: hypothetical protein BECKFM1743A_GA0114220_102327 [Candidatus Kentron sp. FM]VFJ60290.1 MAG: hypothetical protein BECKFM1743C_GA0114222_102701 [Candidatus Kentron sp. FM]VFK12540.1 MAG: hypothetical protein BECKFM1743B_GA0114221_102478 [Candidatus Kentron sp. FM]
MGRKSNFEAYVRRLKLVLALIGGLTLIGTVVLYIQGWIAMREFGPNVTQVMGNFVDKALKTDFAAAGIIRIPIDQGITIQDAARAMEKRAAFHGMKSIDRLVLHGETPPATKETHPYPEILSFHAPKIFPLIIEYRLDLAVYIPYRIVVYQDKDGRKWLATVNPELLIHGVRGLEPVLRSQMMAVKEQLLDIMAAGASGNKTKNKG